MEEMQGIYRPPKASSGEDNGILTIIGGSDLFHGAPIMALKAASKVVDMVFFACPEEYMKDVSAYLKSEISSFIWIPWSEVDSYIDKSDAVLIGPGFKRYRDILPDHGLDEDGKKTKQITEDLLTHHKDKKWVIDAGSLQVIDKSCIPSKAIITPNKHEFELLFGPGEINPARVSEMAKLHHCTIVLKDVETIVATEETGKIVKGGNAGLTKGGTGDVLAGLTAAIYTKNDVLFSACAGSFTVKRAAEQLADDVGVYFSADDLAYQVPHTLAGLVR